MQGRRSWSQDVWPGVWMSASDKCVIGAQTSGLLIVFRLVSFVGYCLWWVLSRLWSGGIMSDTDSSRTDRKAGHRKGDDGSGQESKVDRMEAEERMQREEVARLVDERRRQRADAQNDNKMADEGGSSEAQRRKQDKHVVSATAIAGTTSSSKANANEGVQGLDASTSTSPDVDGVPPSPSPSPSPALVEADLQALHDSASLTSPRSCKNETAGLSPVDDCLPPPSPSQSIYSTFMASVPVSDAQPDYDGWVASDLAPKSTWKMWEAPNLDLPRLTQCINGVDPVSSQPSSDLTSSFLSSGPVGIVPSVPITNNLWSNYHAFLQVPIMGEFKATRPSRCPYVASGTTLVTTSLSAALVQREGQITSTNLTGQRRSNIKSTDFPSRHLREHYLKEVTCWRDQVERDQVAK
ncbi:hypothetical protein SELMODRAFT_445796, partial [Selaginella moellendorffii]